MSKRFVVFLFVMGFVCFARTAEAKQVDGSFWDLKTTVNGSTAAQDKFNLSQAPSAYLFINKNAFNVAPATVDIKWKWFNESKKAYVEKYFSYDWNASLDKAGNFQIWSSPGNWSGLAKTGDWSVKADWKVATSGPTYNTKAKLTTFGVVAPEPVSALLFLLGGAGLGVRRFFGKK